jgi:hypothetical protein
MVPFSGVYSALCGLCSCAGRQGHGTGVSARAKREEVIP